MREDAEKVFTDPARRGSSDPSLDVIRGRRFVSGHRKDVEALDALPFTDPMKRLDWGWGKGINSDFRFIRKFLLSRVGRLWDDVYKEVCEVTNAAVPGAPTLRHHIRHAVETAIEMVDGVPHWFSKYSGLVPLEDYGRWNSFYVEPGTGILRAAPKRKRYVKPSDPDKIVLSETEQLQKIDGIWYLTTRHPSGEVSVYNGPLRVYDTASETWTWKPTYIWVPSFKWTQKQLNKKELKKHGLKNG